MTEKLTIERLEFIPLRVALDHVYRGSYYSMKHRCTIVTRLYTSEGIVGEAYNADTDDEQAAVLTLLNEELAPAVIGSDALRYEDCWRKMLPSTFDQLRDRRLAMQAIACIDTAIWDAIGKAVDLPLHRLWGGAMDQIPIIGIGGYYGEEVHTIEEEVERFAAKELAGMKFKIGGRSPAEDAERLRRAVAAAPEDFAFVVDANQGYDLHEAIRFARLVEDDVELRWFEEPCRWRNDHRDMRDFRLATGLRVAAGQSEISLGGMRDLMAQGSIDVSNFDASWGGGPTEWRRVSAMAEAFGVELGHHEEAHLSIHLLGSTPRGTYVEVFHEERDPIYWQLLENRADARNGYVPLPEKSGLGWVLDPAFIDRYAA